MGDRIATAICVFIFASSLSSFSEGLPVVTLAQCVEQSLSTGPDMRISKANLAVARAQYADSASANGVGLSGSFGYNRAPFTTTYSQTGQANQITRNTFQGGLTLSAPFSSSVDLSGTQSLTEASGLKQATDLSLTASATVWDGYPGGQALASSRIASYTLQGTQSAENANQKTIISNVKQTYYTLLGQQRQIAVLQETLAQRQEELKKTRTLYDAQNASQIDLKQAQVNQLTAELDLRKARGLLEVDREQLSALVGWPLDRQYEAADVGDLPVPDLDVPAAIRSALASREDFRQIQLNLQSNDVSLALKRGQAQPTVSVNTGVGWSQDWSADTNKATWQAGVSVKSPIIDAGSLDAQIREASQQREKLRIQQEQLVNTIATSVKNAVYSLQDLLARVDLAGQSLDLAQNQYDLARLQRDSGVSSNLDFLSASVALTTAKANLAAARSDAQLGIIALQSAMGN